MESSQPHSTWLPEPLEPPISGRLGIATRVRKANQRLATSRRFQRYAPTVLTRTHRFIARFRRLSNALEVDAQPMLLLTATGAKTGQPRQTPLGTVPAESGSYYLVGSNFARQTHPAWTTNLIANPDASIRIHGEDHAVLARQLTPEEVQQVWPRFLLWFPMWADYVAHTDRQFRVFVMIPR